MSVSEIQSEDFHAVSRLYDHSMADNAIIHDIIYPDVFGPDQYIGQFSDNSATELRLLGSLMQLPPRSKVLDVGCGRGFVASFLAREFGWNVMGIDLSTVSIEAGQRMNPDVKLVRGNIYQTSFPRRFDGLYSTGAVCHFDAKKIFRHCRGLLNAGGRLAIFERVRTGVIGLDDWSRLTTGWNCPYVYTLDEYRSLLEEAGFTVRHYLDTTSSFKVWQQRSVEVRDALRDRIIDATSEAYFATSRNLAAYEYDVTSKGLLGYVALIAEANL